MKTTNLIVAAACAFIVAGCAKEKDGYDKNLTRSDWKIKSAEIVMKEIDKTDYLDSTPDETQIQMDSTHIAGSEFTTVNYQLNQEVGSPDFFTRTTVKHDFSGNWIFEEGGAGSYEMTEKRISTFTEISGLPGTTVTHSDLPSTNSSSFYWNWKNNDQQKANLEFPFYGNQPVNFTVVELDKEQLVLEYTYETVSTSQPNANTKETQTDRMRILITFEH